MTDLFEEIEEQLRSERYRELGFRVLPWVLGLGAAALIAALAVWGWQAYRQQAIAKASEEYGAALDAMGQGHEDTAVRLWTEVSRSPARGYRSLALMQLGGLSVSDHKPAEAVKFFDRAAQAAPDSIIGDAARLKSAFALLDTAPEQQVEARLTPLIGEGRPYRVQAREALAFAKLMAGDGAGARREFSMISNALDAPDGARERAKAAINLIDSGSAKAVPGLAKAQAALPPAPQPTPGRPSAQPQPQAPGPQ
ncbi:MAG TPA: tetratricopeptide repeat protein [Phenylobacterium sp.]|uniref:tetratricopeptide repeat protein n=1 Tax=Phenylobacterium sp. TaxID=1871053 RepID=UPI002B9D5B0F|nr:tetratricopeptide repeat protein [Phenylobacterium sp.]HSV03222.1 tetratricopeptide repeat protein [Phenylobacterium sp.]